MPEQIITTPTPLKDATTKATNNHQFKWRFCEFTTNDKHMWNGEPVKTGVRIDVCHPKRGWERFTIRDDYDFALGDRPTGKGPHVNMETPSEKIAYCSTNRRGSDYVGQCWGFISERARDMGDAETAKWYMNDREFVD